MRTGPHALLLAALLLAASLGSTAARAATAQCVSRAAENNLPGAARHSFLKKCEREAQVGPTVAGCEAKASRKKLAGAARKSFMKQCTADSAR